jgi:quercetin dioxygenase-like cupin family protein
MGIRSAISHAIIGCGGAIAGYLAATSHLGIPSSLAQRRLRRPASAAPSCSTRWTTCSAKATTVEVTLAPGEVEAAHRHPGSHTVGYILEGPYEVKIDDGPVRTLKPGEVFYEAPNALHAVSRNASTTQPLKYLVIQLSDPSKPATVAAE